MLKINEIFGPTIQGEGKSVGKEVVFIRTSFCNLKCIWCDTKYAWDWTLYNKEKEVHIMSIERIISKLFELTGRSGCRSIVVSGGEPLLQQKQLISLFLQLRELDNYWIEIETNGTIIPNKEFYNLVDQINCSPKLANSGMSKEKRERPALVNLAQNAKTNFKFVIGNESDCKEVLYLVDKYLMREVYLMPLGLNKEQLSKTTNLTKELCKKYSFNFTDRLHITQFGGGRGI